MRFFKKKKRYSFFYRNGLILTFLLLFLISWAAQSYNGRKEFNDFLKQYDQPPVDYLQYLTTGHFLQSTFENWESEFFQMALYVVLTIFLRQQGSSESKACDAPIIDPSELKPKHNSPWPVRRGGVWLFLYKHSLSVVLFLLFFLTFGLHWYGSWKDYNLQQVLEHKPVKGFWVYITSSRLWFESFQNWQSEFLSVFSIIFLSIYLRQMGSSQSKKVNEPHDHTEG